MAEKTTKRPYKARKKKLCPICNKMKPVDDYYASYSEFHKDGLCPYCKDCVKERAYNKETNMIDEDKLKGVLRQIDKPFISSVFKSAIKQYNNTFEGKEVPVDNRKLIISYYFKNIQTLKQYKALTWETGLKLNAQELGKFVEPEAMAKIVEEEYQWNMANLQSNLTTTTDFTNFVITPEMRVRFGDGYTPVQYKAMNDKYNFLSKSYATLTNLHEEALVTYVKYKIMEEDAIKRNDVGEAEKWGKLANNAANQAKLSPNQLTAQDLQGGVNSFSEFFSAIEQADDLYEILPKYKENPLDAADFIIYCYTNYIRKLEGKPEVEYKDIWAFYDAKVKEYSNITDNTTVANREKISEFVEVPDDY